MPEVPFTGTITGTMSFPDVVPPQPPDPPDPEPADTFVLGETRPSLANTSTPATAVGPRVPETSMRNYDGDLTNVAAGEVVDRLIVTGQFKPSTAGWTLQDSVVLGGVPHGDDESVPPADRNAIWPLLDVRGVPAGGGLIQFVELRPTYQSHEVYGLKGGNVTVLRSIIGGTTDGVQPHGSGTHPNNTMKFARLHGCLIGALRTFADPNQSDGWTHNDDVQSAGALDELEIVGCAIYGGRTSCILLQQQSGLYGSVLIDRNWLYGNHDVGSTINTSQNGRGVIAAGGGLTITRNRIAKSGKEPQILIAADTLAAASTTIEGNVYIEDGTPAKITKGAN